MASAVHRMKALTSVPGLLSLSRVGLAVWFPFAVDSPLLALAIVAGAALSDFLDGWYARRFHLSSPTGAVLDPITDKIFALSVMLSLIAAGKLHIVSALLLSVRELGELPLAAWLAIDRRARAICTRDLRSNVLGKVTTAVQFGALIAILLGQGEVTWWLVATALLGALAAWSYWAQFRLRLAAAQPSGATTPAAAPSESATARAKTLV